MHSRLPLGSAALPLVLEPPVRGRRPPVYGRLLLLPDRPPPDTDLVVPVQEDRRDSYRCLPRDRATGPVHRDLRHLDHEARLLDRGPPRFLIGRPRFRRAAQTRGDGPRLTAAARERSCGTRTRRLRPRSHRQQRADHHRRFADRGHSPSDHDPTTSDPDRLQSDRPRSPSDRRRPQHDRAYEPQARPRARRRRTHIRERRQPCRRLDTQ
jgi:hypothetical protein